MTRLNCYDVKLFICRSIGAEKTSGSERASSFMVGVEENVGVEALDQGVLQSDAIQMG